jgi:hypothetical protein
MGGYFCRARISIWDIPWKFSLEAPGIEEDGHLENLVA